MTTLFVVCGRVNYTNLSRYSTLDERTYRRHFQGGLGLESLNRCLIEQLRPAESQQIVVVDCTFNEKSGRHTYGLDWFYNSKAQRAEKGLEWSVVAIVDLQQKTGYTLSAQQTEAGLSTDKTNTQTPLASKSRVDFYLGHLAYCTTFFPDWIRYVVADGFYSKSKWVNGVVDLGFEAIGRLRSDANLKFLYDGPQKGRGRPRRYDGKVDLTNPSRLTFVETVEKGVSLYTALVWSVNFQRPIRLAYLLNELDGRRSYVVFFSTDVAIDPLHLYDCYRARFQIEFIFRSGPSVYGLF